MVARWAILPVLLAAPLAAQTLRQREAEYYRIVAIPTPDATQFEAGALEFLQRDRLACSTRTGEIWIADGVLADPPRPRWRQIERGLHEVLGLARQGDWLYAQQFCELSRLKIVNDRATRVERVNADWAVTGDYHEYAFCSKFDREGNLWVVLCLTGSFSSDGPWRGWCLRVTPDGKSIPTCSGVRSPGGIGFNAVGDCFFTDNQGPWNGTRKLQWLKPGAFVGHPASVKWYDDPRTKHAAQAANMKKPLEPTSSGRMTSEMKRIPELLPPAVYFPYGKMGQSAAGFACDQTGGGFGPFRDQLFVGDQMHSTVMRVSLEKIGDNYQGACYPFREGFGSGCLNLQFAADGSLFVFGTDRGWSAKGGKSFALEKLVWTGKTPFELLEMKARPDGFRLLFTEPVDPVSAGKIESYAMESYIYIYQSNYGSPEVDQTRPTIQSATISPDGMRVDLKIDGLVEGHVHELQLKGVRSTKGQPLLHDVAYYTLNKQP